MKYYADSSKELYYTAMKFVQHEEISEILEIGCSHGQSLEFIKRTFPHANIHGTERDDWAWRRAKEHKSLLDSLEFVNLNKDELPHRSESFDLVACDQVLEHIYQVDYALDEIYRVLRPGGYFICGTPNLAALHERVSLLFGFNPTTWHTANIQLGINHPKPTYNRTHCNGFTVRGLRQLLSHHSFKTIKYWTSEVYIGKHFYIPLLARVFKNLALSQCWVARK